MTRDHAMPTSPYEVALFRYADPASTSTSHGHDHMQQALSFAKQLCKFYSADIDIVTASVVLHDLGRNNTALHGPASAEASADAAKPILAAIGFPAAKAAEVLRCITEHDQPALRPTTLEGRILKESDFLGGFGAEGIVRAALWTGESGGSALDFLDRIGRKMAERLHSLEFPESQAYAMEQYAFVRLFIDRLQNTKRVLARQSSRYIAFEGISGSGKSSQAALFAAAFRGSGARVLEIREPSTNFANNMLATNASINDHTSQFLLYLLDRYTYIAPKICRALGKGTAVVSDRSFFSTAVYQSGRGWLSPENIVYMHGIVPQPTHVVVLDINPQEAYRRIVRRATESGALLGKHETPAKLSKHRKHFLRLAEIMPNAHIVRAGNRSADEIHHQVLSIVGL